MGEIGVRSRYHEPVQSQLFAGGASHVFSTRLSRVTTLKTSRTSFYSMRCGSSHLNGTVQLRDCILTHSAGPGSTFQRQIRVNTL